ncbi:MAG: hypothetical protein IPN90_13215 [Elusimicrobia bacterium]|nr:hypothetical protein [Elusimicrobiota bacterium]
MTDLGRLRLFATGTLAAVSGGAALMALWMPGGRPIFLGLGVVAVLAIPSYWALSLTLRLSNSRFYGSFVGGMFARMGGVGVCVGLLWRYERAAVVPFVLAAAVGLVGVSFVEMYFIGRQNRLPN